MYCTLNLGNSAIYHGSITLVCIIVIASQNDNFALLSSLPDFSADCCRLVQIVSLERNDTTPAPEQKLGDGDGSGMVLHRSVLSPDDLRTLLTLATKLDYHMDDADTIDGNPSFQVDLWNHVDGETMAHTH